MRAAGAAGEIVPVSGWRPRAQQQSIWDDTMRKEGEAFTKQFVAKPGCSEHETGLAIDLARAAHIDFIRPHLPYDGACGRFRALAAKYGFIQRYSREKTALTGIACEPWHFRYVGGAACAADGAERPVPGGICPFPARNGPPSSAGLRAGAWRRCFMCPARGGQARLPDGCVQVSGDNAGGFIATVWQAAAWGCGA